ncbi:probable ethanolamine kinase [Tanacetum coccineum]
MIILNLFPRLFKQWSNLDESHFSAERLSSGITNLCRLDHVYKIALVNTPLIAFTAVLKVSVKEEDENMVHVTELTGHLNAPVVFAHNDLLSGNLMLNDDESKL